MESAIEALCAAVIVVGTSAAIISLIIAALRGDDF